MRHLGGRLAQLVRVLVSHTRGHWFKSSIAHHISSSHNEELPLRELLEVLLGAEGRRKADVETRDQYGAIQAL